MTPNDPTQTKLTFEQARQRLETEFASQQSNVLPLDAARNEGRFYGNLIRGDRSLNPIQRIGFFLMGFLACSQTFFVIVSAFPQLAKAAGMRVLPESNRAVVLAYLPFSAIILFFGIKFIVTAVAPRKQKQ
jgi:hypothetical protein